MLILFVQMILYDATVRGYAPQVSLPCRNTITVTLTNCEQVHSRECSVSTHRTLPYGQDLPLSDVTTSAVIFVPLVSAHGTALVDSILSREMSSPFCRTSGHLC
ncbi:hypothetical protein AVEN_69271-1 [Araneus ventricosus]|uniref:Uncharacterized protein n=1 Tax=Araneus ventricosus TaxID=182803 RepID=A0A4Y2JZG7_ARAVE|nr:hypothetical protein AVEN_69271-1 [Araneus ventricosus]